MTLGLGLSALAWAGANQINQVLYPNQTIVTPERIVIRNAGNTPVNINGYLNVSLMGGNCSTPIISTDGSRVTVNYTGGPTFAATIEWPATAWGSRINYVVIYDQFGQSVAVSNNPNVCPGQAGKRILTIPSYNGPFTYRIFEAECIKPGACSGCGSDYVIKQSQQPFGPNQWGNCQ